MHKSLIFIGIFLVSPIFCDVDLSSDKFTNLKSYAKIPAVFWRALVHVQQLWLNMNSRRRISSESGANLLEPFPDNFSFPCDTKEGRSQKRPTSVHKLRPGDIDIIGAIGDSLTTASGALSSRLGHMFTENRGLAWNIALGVGFNTAEIGAITFDLPGMAQVLVERMKKDPRVNFEKDWKMVTIAIGANDICSYVCSLDDPNTLPEKHGKNLLETLRYFKQNLPRAFINVVSKPKVSVLLDYREKSPKCEILQLGMCSCFSGLFFNATAETRKWFNEIEDRYIKVEQEVAKSNEFRGLQDFAVVYQPFGLNTSLNIDGNGDDRALLGYDCFHISQKGHSYSGISLWNNLLQAEQDKQTSWNSPHKQFICPSVKHPYLYTYEVTHHR
ncbi:phospholipase B1, membrane-associated-like [Culicoides brevitarsis]|uniref:phospholipase B1, membrane-associated-like n=1 Tax=Culicoides brevitarsis TaxID=469753 RepID=UPI00307B7512